MSYRLAVLSDLPVAFWPLDETAGTTLADLSGFDHTGTNVSGAPGLLGQPGILIGMRSMQFTAAERFSAVVPGFLQRDKEEQSFALEVWVKPTSPPTAARGILGRDINHGITLTPGGVELRIASVEGEVYRAYYTVTDWDQPLHIIANYVGRNLGLIVNGQEGTNADFVGSINATSNTLMIGGGTGSIATTVQVSAPAVYKRPLNIRHATTHYDWGREAMSPLDLASGLGGTYYALDDAAADVMFEYIEDTRDDFMAGTTEGLYILDDYLTALDTDGTHTSDLQYVGDLTNIAGSRIDWYASTPVIVEISWNNGVSWTPCTNHAEVPGLAPGAYLANKFFRIRKRFTGVTTTDYSMLFDRLKIVVYRSKVSQANTALTTAVYGNPTLAESAISPARQDTHMGATFNTSSHMMIPAGDGVRTIEFWYKRNAETAGVWQYVIDTRFGDGTVGGWLATTGSPVVFNSGGWAATYVNGVAKALSIADFPIGRWVHVALVLPATSTSNLYLNSRYTGVERGDNSIAHLTLSPTALDARSIATRYNMQTGLVNTTYVDSTAMTVREVPSGITAYSYAWSSVQSGIS